MSTVVHGISSSHQVRNLVQGALENSMCLFNVCTLLRGQIVQSSCKEIVPKMFRGWLLTLENFEDSELYEAPMLLLFDPWRELRRLKNGHKNFGKAFTEFELER